MGSINTMRAHAKRRAAKVFAERGLLCYWCLVPLVHIRAIPQEDRIKFDGITVTYRWRGATFTGFAATIDHIIPLTRGGGNEPANMVPSCSPCNNKRGNWSGRP